MNNFSEKLTPQEQVKLADFFAHFFSEPDKIILRCGWDNDQISLFIASQSPQINKENQSIAQIMAKFIAELTPDNLAVMLEFLAKANELTASKFDFSLAPILEIAPQYWASRILIRVNNNEK